MANNMEFEQDPAPFTHSLKTPAKRHHCLSRGFQMFEAHAKQPVSRTSLDRIQHAIPDNPVTVSLIQTRSKSVSRLYSLRFFLKHCLTIHYSYYGYFTPDPCSSQYSVHV